MGIQLDFVIPPIIVGLLVILLLRINSFMMETSVDNRVTNDMQTLADVTTKVLQEELRTADFIINPSNPAIPDSVLKFVSLSSDTVLIKKSGLALQIIHIDPVSSSSDTISYPSNLSSISFDLEPDTVATPYFLNIKVETESLSEDHASMRDLGKTVKAFSENQIYLRNVHLNSL